MTMQQRMIGNRDKEGKRVEASSGPRTRDVGTYRAHLVSAKHSVPSRPNPSNRAELVLRRQRLGDTIFGQDLLSISDSLDPFASLPSKLSKLDEHLIKFYLDHYPQLTYGLSSSLKPHPVSTNFSIALDAPACFQVILSRAALYQMKATPKSDDKDREALEQAHLVHKGNAIHILREAVSVAEKKVKPDHPTQLEEKEELMASIISLGTLDSRIGNNGGVATHFQAVRNLLRQHGGPASIQNMALSRVMCHFECIYGTKDVSYVWDSKTNAQQMLQNVNSFFQQLSNLEISHRADPSCKSMLKVFSALFAATRRPVPSIESNSTPTTQATMALAFQMTCLFTLSLMLMEMPIANTNLGAESETASQASSNSEDMGTKDLMTLLSQLENDKLASLPLNNHAWLLQTYDMGISHSSRIWRAASFVWILKHVTVAIQQKVTKWLEARVSSIATTENEKLRGRSTRTTPEDSTSQAKSRPQSRHKASSIRSTGSIEDEPFRLEPFHFSYAA